MRPTADFANTSDVFLKHVQSVDRLLKFPSEIVAVAIEGLDAIEPLLEQHHLHSALTPLRHRRTLLRGVEDSKSLSAQYEAMFNQCVVLLVSYFDSAVHTLFKKAVIAALVSGANVKVAQQELKISWNAIEAAEGDRATMFVDLLITQNNISFQDMGSIARAFQNHLGVEIDKDAVTNDVILGQACRHAIVHAAAVVDKKMLGQIKDAHPRTLMTTVTPGAPIRFSPEEVRALAASMTSYIGRVVELLNEASTRWARGK